LTVRLTGVWWPLAESEYNYTTDQHQKWCHQRINQLCSLHLVKYFKGNASYAKHVLKIKTFINPSHLKIIPASATVCTIPRQLESSLSPHKESTVRLISALHLYFGLCPRHRPSWFLCQWAG
jgi:hypothetical protein